MSFLAAGSDFMSGFGNLGQVGAAREQSNTAMTVVLIIFGILLIVVAALLIGSLTKGWFRKKLPGESCSINDEDGSDNCGDGLFCDTDDQDPDNNICYVPTPPPPPPEPSQSTEPSPPPTEPSPPPVNLNQVHSGDVVSLMNHGAQHFDNETRYINTNAAGNGTDTGLSCNDTTCYFLIVKYDPGTNAVIKDRTTVIQSGDQVKIYSLDRMAALVAVAEYNLVLVPDACISVPSVDCSTWEQWIIMKDPSTGVIEFGSPVYLKHVDGERVQGKGILDFYADTGSAPSIGQSGPIRNKQWILTKVTGQDLVADTFMQGL